MEALAVAWRLGSPVRQQLQRGLTPSSSAKEKLITDAKTFLMEMESMGFTELEFADELQTSDSNIKQASIWLPQEADKNEIESQGQIPNDAWRKKRSKYKKYMSNICPLVWKYFDKSTRQFHQIW